MAAVNEAASKAAARMKAEANDSDLREHARTVRDDIKTVGHDMRDLAKATGDVALAQLDPIEEYIREKPLRSMMIAAGVGALLGLFLFRK